VLPKLGPTRNDRRARRPRLDSPERLEARDLLAYTPLGYSLPDLVVTGYTGPVATYGGTLAATIDVRNLGASSLVEPLHLASGATSTADAGPFSVGVYLDKGPKFTKQSKLIGTIDFPNGLTQNNESIVTQTFTLPSQPAGFPGLGKNVYVTFVVDVNQQVNELEKINNVSPPVPVLLAPALPQLAAIGLDLPPVLNPGDFIQPKIKIANYGTVPTNNPGANPTGAPVTVLLVASEDATFGPLSQISTVATFTIDNIPPLSEAPTQNLVLGDANITDPANVRTDFVATPSAIVQLPPQVDHYFLGLEIDPNQQIRQISDLRGPRSTLLQLVREVGPNTSGLGPAGVLRGPAPDSNVFPIPPFGPLTSGNAVPIFDPNLYYRPASQPIVHHAKSGKVSQGNNVQVKALKGQKPSGALAAKRARQASRHKST
jgi:hypothetical protein